jgi:hypothetical protein
MLAQTKNNNSSSGKLSPGLQPMGLSLRVVLDFVERELPRWRDNPDRPRDNAEIALTSNLAAYLSHVARHSHGLDILQFRTEIPDEICKGRAIDLAPAPCGATLLVNGRRYTYSDILMPIECKRFPTPKGKNRDEREYVTSASSTTGGIQRFKAGHHGGAHLMGAMIGYVQNDSASEWFKRVSTWIDELSKSGEPGWSLKDLLHFERDESGVHCYRSLHARQNSLPDIKLQHLWIDMTV